MSAWRVFLLAGVLGGSSFLDPAEAGPEARADSGAASQAVAVTVDESDAPPPDTGGGDVYTDQYFSEEELAPLPGERALEEAGLPSTWSAAYRFYYDSQVETEDLYEHGLELRSRYTTLNFGDFEVLAGKLSVDGKVGGIGDDRRLLLSQRQFPLNRDIALDTALGHLRSATPNLIRSSYRYTLPSTILEGATTRVHDGRTSAGLTVGRMGRFEGTALSAFDRTEGTLWGANVAHALSDSWRVAGQYWDTRDARDGTFSNRALAGALQYGGRSDPQLHQLRYLRDDGGNNGTWYDGQSRVARWTHRYGLFRFDPDLRWTSAAIQNDLQGGYWRSDFQSFRWRWTLSTEVSHNNLDGEPTLPGSVDTSSFANGIWQLRRHTQLGVNAGFDTRHSVSGAPLEDSSGQNLRLFVSQLTPLGRTRVESYLRTREIGSDRETEHRLRWDHDWDFRLLDRMASTLEYAGDTEGGRELRVSASASERLSDQFDVNASVQFTRSRSPSGARSDDVNLGFGLDWQPYSEIIVSLTGNWSRLAVTASETRGDTLTDTNVLLSVSYLRSTGRMPVTYGRVAGSRGAGRIAGEVFLDRNQDGVRNADEEVLPGITVFLDGGFSQETDAAGRFEFAPVSAGPHELTLAVWEAPLPWGLDDESPRPVSVGVRGEEQMDFALTRIGN